MRAAETKATHTPGPWQAQWSDKGVRYIAAGDDPSRDIAVVQSLEDGIDNEARLRESDANMRLIAAAPDLLEALTVMVEVHPCDCNNFDTCATHRARAAIAKARGQS